MGIPTYILHETIDEIEQDRFVVRLTFLRMNDDGSLRGKPEGRKELLDVGVLPIETLDSLGVATKDDFLNRLEEWNRGEVERASQELTHWIGILSRLPSSRDAQMLRAFHEAVLGRYAVWYRDNQLDFPESSRVEVPPKQTTKPVQERDRGRLPSVVEREESISAYITVCDELQTTKPTIAQLREVKPESLATWSRYLSRPALLLDLRKELQKKANQAKVKETKEFWSRAVEEVDRRMVGVSQGLARRQERPMGRLDYLEDENEDERENE